MAANPYERRRQPERSVEVAWDRDVTMQFSGGDSPRESPMTFRDIEALIHSARHRGLTDRAVQHVEELRNARREAWEEGHAIGELGARKAILTLIDERVGEEVRAAIDANRELLTKLDADRRKVTKPELAERVRGLGALLERLLEEHHRGFADEQP